MTNALSQVAQIYAKEALPDHVSDGGTYYQRGNGYGEKYVNPLSMHRLAHEGSLYHIANTTNGTGIAQTANTTSDTTKPFITGTVSPNATKSVHLLRLLMKPTAVSSGETIVNIDVVTCRGQAWASAGTDFGTPATGIATAGYHTFRTGKGVASSHSVLRVGVPVTVLGSDPRNVSRFIPRATTIPVIQDQYIMNFAALGDGFRARPSLVIPVGTTIDRIEEDFAPVIIDPGDSYMIIPWAAGILGAMSWEFELVWAER